MENRTMTSMLRTRKNNRQGFTLIELLVVIGIIALLAAILMPSLAKTKELAKASSCLSNQHNLGLGLMMYAADNQNSYPINYNYINGDSSAGGYYHWSAALTPKDYEASVNCYTVSGAAKYPKVAKMFVCPSHVPGGFAPTNFSLARIDNPPAGQVSQDTSGQVDDRQAPRLSYVANEALMPRKKYSPQHDATSPPGTGNLRYVSTEDVDGADNTILLAEFSESANCIWGSSVGGGAAYKSHRPTNGVKTTGGGVFDGEGYTMGTQCFKLTFAEADAAIKAVLADKGAGPTSHHISYVNPTAHSGNGSNYVFADGHAGKQTLKDTFDPGSYMWGKKVYSCADRPTIQDNP
jgi:prepilin-type N-terminal cleavage/methylation domain-containing protein/prepilin-type processing-associated H-X9-DG protein